jgi:formylglycine-generating enzyme required for sulfatase activity
MSKDTKRQAQYWFGFLNPTFVLTAVILAIAMPASAQSQTEQNPLDGLKYVWIAPGAFQMGCSPSDSECAGDEKPVHSVTITKGFWIGKTLVTQAAFKKVRGSEPSRFKGRNLPVEQVSWDDADAYCRSMNMRLPTEAEWEYAARGGNPAARYGPIDQIAWFDGKSTHPVAHKQPNAYGLYDMLGDVFEWTADWQGSYDGASQTDPTGPPSGTLRIARGGSFLYGERLVRVSSRYATAPVETFYDFGFRCVADGKDLDKDILPRMLMQIATPKFSTSTPAVATASNVASNREPAGNNSTYIALSKSTDGNRYFVVFAARGSTKEVRSWAGHAFIVWGIEDTKAQKSSYTAYGMYPKDPTRGGDKNAAYGAVPPGLLKMVFGTPGEVRDEATMHSIGSITNDLIVEVNKSQYDQTFDLAMMTLTHPPNFKLLKSDCVTFMSGIALNLLGQDVPSRNLTNSLPQAYVADLIQAIQTPKTVTGPGLSYTGQTWLSIPNGEGAFTLATGERFTGRVVMGYPREGTVTYPNGATYTGTLKDAAPDGHGTFSWPGTGMHFDGEFEKGHPKHGMFYFKDGTTVTGDLKDGRYDGPVVMNMPDGSQYEGQFTNGKIGQHGTLTLSDGSRYEGDWSNGKPQGHGTLTLRDGSRYEGEFSDGRPNGTGAIFGADGSRATGTWKDGRFDAEHAHYRDPNGREHGFEDRDRGDPSGDDMRGTITVKDSEGRTIESHEIRGMTIGGRGDD